MRRSGRPARPRRGRGLQQVIPLRCFCVSAPARTRSLRGGGQSRARRRPCHGLLLHRAFPRQEITIEITGDDTRRVMVDVYFNPGDAGTAMEYGYRGSPCCIDLGFDVGSDFRDYAVDGGLGSPRGWWTAEPSTFALAGTRPRSHISPCDCTATSGHRGPAAWPGGSTKICCPRRPPSGTRRSGPEAVQEVAERMDPGFAPADQVRGSWWPSYRRRTTARNEGGIRLTLSRPRYRMARPDILS